MNLELSNYRGFEKYSALKPITVKSSHDLLSKPGETYSPEVLNLLKNLSVLHHFELEDKGSTRRDIVLMADKDGNSSIVVVCRDNRYPRDRSEAYGNLAVIGGCGIYDTPRDKSPIEFALDHTKLLSVVMARKTWMAGLELGGMKATIPGESDWEKSTVLQKATGFLFSKEGVFTDAITGSDVRQTPGDKGTIANMFRGSQIGGSEQIAGMIKELDTPGSCRFSLDQTYQALQELYGNEKIPDLNGSTVLIEGFGRIGRPAARLILDRGQQLLSLILY